MKRSQANRSVVTARAEAGSATCSSHPDRSTVSRNPALRAITPITETGHVKRSSAVKMTGAQKNSQGYRSEWNDSTDFFTCPKWDQTVSSQRV